MRDITQNQMLDYAKYSITVLMFNHVISGIESVWYSQKKASGKLNEASNYFSNINLVFNPQNINGCWWNKNGVEFLMRIISFNFVLAFSVLLQEQEIMMSKSSKDIFNQAMDNLENSKYLQAQSDFKKF